MYFYIAHFRYKLLKSDLSWILQHQLTTSHKHESNEELPRKYNSLRIISCLYKIPSHMIFIWNLVLTVSADFPVPGGHLNIKMSSYQYQGSHYKDKTISWLSYHYNGNAHTWKDCLLYWDRALIAINSHSVVKKLRHTFPDNKVHGANMGPTWVLSAPDGPHVGPMELAIRVMWHARMQLHNCHTSVITLAACGTAYQA